MAQFSPLVITQKGKELLAKVVLGSNVNFSKMVISEASYEENELEMLEALNDIKQENLISGVRLKNKTEIEVESAFSNAELEEGYYMRTVGLYALDPAEGEVLCAVSCEESANCYMPPFSGSTVTGSFIKLILAVANAENIKFQVNPAAVASIADIIYLQEQIDAIGDRARYSTIINKTLIANQWNDYEYDTFAYSLDIEEVEDNSICEVLPEIGITPEQLKALQKANIQEGWIADGELGLQCYGKKPTIDIPVRIIIRGDTPTE